MTLCERCKERSEKHPLGKCPDGKGMFTWKVSNELLDFVRENSDLSPKQLTEKWIERVRNRK